MYQIVTRKKMTLKEELIRELDDISEPIILEVLDFLYFLKAKQEQDSEDLKEARAVLSMLKNEDTVAWEDLKAETGL